MGWFTLAVLLFCIGLAFVSAFGWCCYIWKCKHCTTAKVTPGEEEDEEEDAVEHSVVAGAAADP